MNINSNIREMGFDSSLFDTLDAQLTPVEFKEYLAELARPILRQRFINEFPKQQVLFKTGRISFACPFCGDSMKNSYAKRGNFILEGVHRGFYKCHNCGEFKHITNFFKDFKTELRLDAVNYLVENTGNFSSQTNVKYDMSMLLDMNSIEEYAIDRTEFSKYFGLIEVKNSSIWSWLKGRMQFQEEKFLYNPLNNYLLILNLTKSGKILGAQKRLFKGNNRFESFKLSKLYEKMKRTTAISEEQMNYLDMLSMIFNVCLVRFDIPLTLFEGPMDSFLFKNSIANTGANKTLPIDVNIRYFYDYDQTGIKKSLEHINKNEEVFLWEKLCKDLNLPSRKKWDMNDLVTWSKHSGTKLPLLDRYFSNDPLDAMDI